MKTKKLKSIKTENIRQRTQEFFKSFSILSIILSIFFSFIPLTYVQAGSITSPGGAPTATSYTLTDIFNRIKTNATATLGGHSLSPTTTPQSTYHSLVDIYNAIPTIYSGDFLASSTYFGVTGSITIRNGNIASATTSTSTNMLMINPPTGYYDGSATVSTTSTDFIASNIKSGVNLFGLLGTYTAGGGGSPANKTPLKTGQTLCYGNTGTPISCVGTGQDGETQNGTARSYTDNGDGTISDNATGLMWEKCTYGLSGVGCATGAVIKVNWNNATSSCESATTGGFSDWKLPNVNELSSIIDYNPADPLASINATYFPNTKTDDYYWTSTQEIYSRPNAWVVDFYNGVVTNDVLGNTDHIRCVRQQVSPASSASAQLVKTGQDTCFDSQGFPGLGQERSCVNTGQDGFYKSGTARSFTNNGDGTISDNATGLMWQRCPYSYIGTYCDDFDQNAVGYSTFSDANNICNAATTGGHTDWRIPNINEMKSIIDFHRLEFVFNNKIAVDSVYFPHEYGDYITSTIDASSAIYGSFSEKTVSNYEGYSGNSGYDLILCVR